MKQSSKISPKIIVSGGGTGGHIYPAIAIADEIKRRLPNAQILFVGAEGKMEIEKVPKAGYPVKGLPVVGFDRGNLLKNISFPFKLIKSLNLASKIVKEFQPDIAIGTGGFASGPILQKAAKMGVPIVIQEQNSFPGITNKILSKNASAICVAYDGIKHFPKEVTHHTGNPIRSELFRNLPSREEAIRSLGLDPNKKVVLSVGGSLGSRTLNNVWLEAIQQFQDKNVQLIWQTGKLEYEKIITSIGENQAGIYITEFIYNMKDAYAAADVIVSRAGAMAISELCLIGKPVILVPFPFAAEDHQTKNAQALVQKEAALMFTDEQASKHLADAALQLTENEMKQKSLAQNILKLGKPNATKEVVDILLSKIK